MTEILPYSHQSVDEMGALSYALPQSPTMVPIIEIAKTSEIERDNVPLASNLEYRYSTWNEYIEPKKHIPNASAMNLILVSVRESTSERLRESEYLLASVE